MASSFSSQIPIIIHLIQQLKPIKLLDIGKGFGKYGFLIHEYLGIDNQKQPDPKKSMADQSMIQIDAIEVDEILLLPHLNQFYRNIFFGDVFDFYKNLEHYDCVLMIDVIEHLPKEKAIELLKYLISKGSIIVIATPTKFFEQNVYGSEFENHISHWSYTDFKKIGNVDYQIIDAGAIYLLSNKQLDIRGFGCSLIKKMRRIARAVLNEFYI